MQLANWRPFAWVVAICLSACLYDRDDRCGAHQELEDGICVCVEGYRLSGNACAELVDAGAAPEDAGDPQDAGDGARPPYSGQKEPCTSHADCAGYDATYCNPLIMKCLVEGCTETSCDPGYMCIDLGMYIPGEPKVCLDPADFMR